MTYRLFIDDERFPADKDSDMVIARTLEEVQQIIESKGIPSFISFDHDLGQRPSGYDIAKWLSKYVMDNNLDLPKDFEYTVHSMNPIGAANIRSYMDLFLRIVATYEKE